MEDANMDYTKRNIRKNMILLEDHMKQNTCPDCVNKHMDAVEGYAEEGATMTECPLERQEFVDLSQQIRTARKKFNDTVGTV
jgi:hypothetical protein